MSVTLRILLLFGAVVTAVWILYKIRKLKVKMEDAVFWIVFAGILCLMGIFPQITYKLSDLFGIQSPANLIFLVIIFLLIEKVFTLSILVSQLEDKVSVLSAEMSIRSYAAEKKIRALRVSKQNNSKRRNQKKEPVKEGLKKEESKREESKKEGSEDEAV